VRFVLGLVGCHAFAHPVRVCNRSNRTAKACHPVIAAILLTVFAPPVFAQPAATVLYQVDKEGQARTTRDHRGQPGLYVTVQFTIKRAADGQLATDVAKDEIVVEEDGRRVTDLELQLPGALEPLTIVLALDTSGSMDADNKMSEAKAAARLLLETLNERVDCGLILFDHRLHVVVPPVRDRARTVQQRERLRKHIDSAKAGGGTAYLDATAKAIEMLRGIPGRKAVILMTDGVDLNSKATLADVVRQAQQADVRIYTLGVGEPGKGEPVTTVLVLDHSGSMSEPADNRSKTPKITALHRAAGRFVDVMRPGARTSLLPFSSLVDKPGPFVASKQELKGNIEKLKPEGETALFDAVLAAVQTLEAGQPEGKRAVVALTDGIDNSSRRRVEEVIERAKEAGVPLHMLGLGRPGELDETVMKRMASQTGGEYHHAQTEDKLIDIFEALSIRLHDDGFDHDSLNELAKRTFGKFYHARRAADLRLYYREIADELQTTYTVTFKSRRPVHDGTSRGIDISVIRNGIRVSNVASADYTVHGAVVPKMDQGVYLILLLVFGVLLAIPVGLRRLYRLGLGGRG
jgi:VWFA-related protein